MVSATFAMPQPAPLPPAKLRRRHSRDALAWRVKDNLDRIFLPPAVERLLIRLGKSYRKGGASERPIRRLYVDISVIARSDAGTGIQRVVRSVYTRLEQICANGTTVIPVVVNRRREGYRTLDGKRLQGGEDAVFFGLDFATDSIFRYRRELARFRKSGGRLWFVLHDILPLSHPHWFTSASGLKYRRWLRVLAGLSDGLICVSPTVASQLADLLRERYGLESLPRIIEVPLGSSIVGADASPVSVGTFLLPGLSRERLAEAALVVGTLEPRKGHADVLDAFELLWNQGSRIPLVLIGRPGWNTEVLQERIRNHPRAADLLFWYDGIDDDTLRVAYAGCRMAIVPSLAEGYGLPLDEALCLGVPVLARDIPVFRRHTGAALEYFSEHAEPTLLAQAIVNFHASAPGLSRSVVSLVSWTQTAVACIQAIGCARAPSA
jgi:glycosyltransferase involved in cell wall biosynthesis